MNTKTTAQDLNAKTYTEICREATDAVDQYTAHVLISPKGRIVRVARHAVAPRLAAGYRYAE